MPILGRYLRVLDALGNIVSLLVESQEALDSFASYYHRALAESVDQCESSQHPQQELYYVYSRCGCALRTLHRRFTVQTAANAPELVALPGFVDWKESALVLYEGICSRVWADFFATDGQFETDISDLARQMAHVLQALEDAIRYWSDELAQEWLNTPSNDGAEFWEWKLGCYIGHQMLAISKISGLLDGARWQLREALMDSHRHPASWICTIARENADAIESVCYKIADKCASVFGFISDITSQLRRESPCPEAIHKAEAVIQFCDNLPIPINKGLERLDWQLEVKDTDFIQLANEARDRRSDLLKIGLSDAEANATTHLQMLSHVDAIAGLRQADLIAGPSRIQGRSKMENFQMISSYLTLHHKYFNRRIEDWNPVKGTDVAKATGIGKPRVSEFIKREFGGQCQYKQLCQQQSPALIQKIMNWNCEYSTDSTYGSDPDYPMPR